MYVSIRDDIVLCCGYPTVLTGLSDLGVRAVEVGVSRDYGVHPLSLDAGSPRLHLNVPADVTALGAQAAAAGVRISAFLMPNNFNAPDIDVELDWAVGTIRAAAELGVQAVRIDAVMHGEDELPLEERQRTFADRVRQVLAATDGLPVELGIENHGLQGNDPEFLEGMFALVGSDRLGMTLDTGNFYWSGIPLSRVYEIIERLAPRTKHTHVKNISYPEAMRQQQRPLGYEYETYCCPIPEGDVDHSIVVGLLKAAGYERDLCIEDESFGRYQNAERQVNMRAAAAYLQGLVDAI